MLFKFWCVRKFFMNLATSTHILQFSCGPVSVVSLCTPQSDTLVHRDDQAPVVIHTFIRGHGFESMYTALVYSIQTT